MGTKILGVVAIAGLLSGLLSYGCGGSSSEPSLGGSDAGAGAEAGAAGGDAGSAPVSQCIDEDKDGVPGYCSGAQPAVLDCDDEDPQRFPGNAEVCDLVDNDCNGLVDDDAGAPACPLNCERTEGACDPAVQIVANRSSACYRTASGRVYCWGEDSDGASGDVQRPSAAFPQPVPGTLGATQIVRDGDGATCAILSQDAVCWGNGVAIPFHQQLPDGADPTSYVLSDAYGLCGLTETGAVACQALATAIPKLATPFAQPAVTGAIELAAFEDLLCAVLADTSIHCWGDVRNGGPVDSAAPLSTGAKQLTVGPTSVCAIIAGQLECWAFAELSGNFDMPVIVPGMGGATQLGLSINMACGAANGEVACWNGTKPEALQSMKAVAIGANFGCAIVLNGAIQCWGLVSHGSPSISIADLSATAEGAPYALSAEPEDSRVLLASPASGACDNPADLALAVYDAFPGLDRPVGLFGIIRQCATSCVTTLDAASCLKTCYTAASSVGSVSSSCFDCFANYWSCTSGDCWATLNSCAGYPVLNAFRYFDEETVLQENAPCFFDCANKSGVDEECSSDSDCLAGSGSCQLGYELRGTPRKPGLCELSNFSQPPDK